MKELLKNGEVIYNIPNITEYRKIIDILRSDGYKIYKEYKDEDFHNYPNIIYLNVVCGNCTKIPTGYYNPNHISMGEFYTRIGRKSEVDGTDWRDKLSEKFQEKLKTV